MTIATRRQSALTASVTNGCSVRLHNGTVFANRMIGWMNVGCSRSSPRSEQQRAGDLAAIDRPDRIDDQRDNAGHVVAAGSIGWQGSRASR